MTTDIENKDILEEEVLDQELEEASTVEERADGQPDEEMADEEEAIATEEEPEEEEEIPVSRQELKKQEKSTKMKRMLRKMLRDDDSDEEGGSLSDMFTDIQISGEWLKHHWSFLFIMFVCMLLFVTNRYQAQQEIIEEARLKQELHDWKYVWLTQFSELTRSTRQSHIEESLRQRGDSTLKQSKEAPFIIKVK